MCGFQPAHGSRTGRNGEVTAHGFLLFMLIHAGQRGLKKEHAQHQEHDQQLDQDYRPEDTPPGHLPESVDIQGPYSPEKATQFVHKRKYKSFFDKGPTCPTLFFGHRHTRPTHWLPDRNETRPASVSFSRQAV